LQGAVLVWTGVACFVSHAEGGSTKRGRALEVTSIWALILFQVVPFYLSLFVRCPSRSAVYAKTIAWFVLWCGLLWTWHFALEYYYDSSAVADHLEKVSGLQV
jgi:hypothetical protein